ncbi:hypothetical protein [Thiocystis violacea]|uniref:hypothetical protein n=1 Tax=Thiocystis violacea TaxID=13725 RepID=UPI001908DB6D|nr:hypothetical protein [Thiocystis violacea]MBK1718520.1 hypothetical protein [Thiocystis violacea]
MADALFEWLGEEDARYRQARFVAYLVANDRNEYLAKFKQRRDGLVLAWTPFPDYARLFRAEKAAARVLRAIDRPDRFIVRLLETDDQWIVPSEQGRLVSLTS